MAEPAAQSTAGPDTSAASDLRTSGELDGTTLDVSIILPVFNEVEHLKQEVDRVRAAMDASEYSYEIIIVDDGSSDGSGELAQTLPNIRVIRFLQNRGSGSSRKAGTTAARGRVTVWTDVDMTYPNDDIPQLVKELEGYDQVVGARTTEEGTMKALRVPAKWFIRTLASFLTETKIPDLNSGFRAFRTERRSPVPPAPSARVLVRHDDDDDIPLGRLLGEVHPDRVRQAGGRARSSTRSRTLGGTASRSCAWCCRTTRCASSCRPVSCCSRIGLTQDRVRLHRVRLPRHDEHVARLVRGVPGVRNRSARRPRRTRHPRQRRSRSRGHESSETRPRERAESPSVS